jgi:hypothetical protein
MECETKLDVAEVERVVSAIFKQLRASGVSSLTLSDDDYWETGSNDRYDFGRIPQVSESGKLSEDWRFLCSILKDEDYAVLPMLVHVAPILRAIGEGRFTRIG